MERERIELQKALVDDISKGMRQLKQVKVSSSSEQQRVVERMLSSYEEALLILTGRGALGGECQSPITWPSNPPASPPPARQGGARKRRRAVPKKVTFKIKVSGDDSEGAADDGYSWRKYGQKPVLNSIYPRNYFKCKQGKSCGARKHEERSENDPTTVHVTYTGVHTCQPKSEVISSSSNMGDIEQEQLDLPMDLNVMAEEFLEDLSGR